MLRALWGVFWGQPVGHLTRNRSLNQKKKTGSDTDSDIMPELAQYDPDGRSVGV